MKRNHLVFTVCFLMILSFLAIGHFFHTDTTFSEQENRYLAQKPKISMNAILSGKYMADFETYVSDQFIWKQKWVSLKAKSEKVLLKQEINDVYIGEADYLFEKFPEPGKQWERNLQYINDFSKERDVSVLLAPTSSAIYNEKLPMFAPIYSQQALLEEAKRKLNENVKIIDVFEVLKEHKNEDIYFKLDHHWTMRGAYYAYREAAQALDFTPYDWADFSREEISNQFYGTYAAKALGQPLQADRIELFTPNFPVEYRLQYNEEEKVYHELYNWDALELRNQYAFFLGTNEPLVKIRSNVKSGRKLAVIKDSYAHVMMPFLANHYSDIHMIDLRYFRTNIRAYLEQNEIDEVLFLYNIPNFTKDSQLIWLRS